MNFAEYIKYRLTELQYDTVFGVPGKYIMPLWQTFRETPRLVLARHESGAAYMADGWARIKKKPGVVLTTVGPGQTNMTTGVACAYKDSVPLLVISGQAEINTFGKGAFQECYPMDRGFSPVSIFSPVTKGSFEITNIENAAFIFETAFRLAISGRPGPVHLSIPFDIQEMELPEDLAARTVFKTDCSGNDLIGENFHKVIETLIKAKRPLILVGWGCYLSGRGIFVETLAEKLGAPVISTIKGLASVGAKNPWVLGHIGPGQKKEMINQLLYFKPDAILILGASLSAYYFDQMKTVIQNATIVQVDIESEQIGFRYPIDLGIQADLRDWLPAFKKVLPEVGSEEYNKRLKEVQKMKNIIMQDLSNIPEENLMAGTIRELNNILPENVIIIPDAGNHWLNSLNYFNPGKPGGIFTNIGLGAMGYAPGAAIGMQIASSDKRVICITGDGSVLMSGTEISVAGELHLNSIFIIYNNQSLGRVRTYQHFKCDDIYIGSDIFNVDFVKWAEAMGISGTCVTSLNEFRKAVKDALKSNGPVVIEVIVSKDEIPNCLISVD